MNQNYKDFIERKKHSINDAGIKVNWMPEMAFDFQQHIIEKAINKGRCAIFADTGLGKTLIELVIAQNYVNHTNKRVLILTPLAVAFQFMQEAEKLGIDDIEHTRDGKNISKKIVICNYERLHYLDSKDFEVCICDESSILKNFDGITKQRVTEFMRKMKYRFLATATPAPNDYIELGTSSEALGHLGYMDMLSKFFKNDASSIDIRHAGCKWYLKPHAENDFWKWVSQWSISIRKPSDLGFADDNYNLPELIEKQTVVNNPNALEVNGQAFLFSVPALSFREITAEVRQTITQRCEKAFELASKHDTTVYWVNRNNEAQLLRELDKDAIEIKGNMNIDKKEEILLSFSKGEINKLITKTSITAFGLNWQHCNHTTYFPTYSYEQYYQAIRRFWRFGQKNPVTVDLVLSDGQTRIMKSLEAKKEKAIEMFEHLSKNVNSVYSIQKKEFNQKIQKPSFL